MFGRTNMNGTHIWLRIHDMNTIHVFVYDADDVTKLVEPIRIFQRIIPHT